MALIEDLLFNRLKSAAGLTALAADRIYPVTLPPECPLPAVTCRRASTVRYPLDAGDAGIAQPHFEVAAWADKYDQARALAREVRLTLERWQDEANGVQDTYIVDEFEDFQPEALVYYRVVVAEVVHNEEV